MQHGALFSGIFQEKHPPLLKTGGRDLSLTCHEHKT